MRSFAALFCAVFMATAVTVVPVLPAPALSAAAILHRGLGDA